MSMTGFEPFDRAVQKAFVWLNEVMEEMGTSDRHKAYIAMRGALHALRDRLPVVEAAQLAAQMPLLLRGLYYEGWSPAHVPVRLRHRQEFLEYVARAFPRNSDIDPEQAVRATFTVLRRHITPGELEDVIASFPKEMRDLWGEAVPVA